MSLIKALASPELVAHFQKLCGLHEVIENNVVTLKYNGAIHYFMTFGSSLAGEHFFSTWIAIQSWWMDIYVSRKVIMSITLAMVVGQGIKDTFKIPRPSCPPVTKLETTYETEYGTPSTHTAIAGSFSTSIALFAGYIIKIPRRKELLVAACYTSYVGISRIYVGVHSFLDVISGGILSVGIIYNVHDYISTVQDALLESSQLTLVYAGCMFVIAAAIFKLDNEIDPATQQKRWNTGKGDACRVLAMNAGFVVGSHFAIKHGLYPLKGPLSLTSIDELKTLLMRMVIGVIITIPLSLAIRKSTLKLFSTLFRIPLADKAEAIKKEPLELFYKFFATFLILGTTSTLVPYAFHVLKI